MAMMDKHEHDPSITARIGRRRSTTTRRANTGARNDARRMTLRRVEVLLPILTMIGLYWFSTSFFLAKRSLPQTSTCDEAPELLRSILGLSLEESQAALLRPTTNDDHHPHLQQQQQEQQQQSTGCWLDRRIDSLVILVVDALRFDFAQHHLPMSVGARLNATRDAATTTTTSSQLLQFVADPPTVTMQRLKGLTTGSLPTFADISGNFGGSTVDEDSWVQQLKSTPFQRRGLSHPSRLGFVGDDTWVDLFPTQFEVCYPLPSFNTRDLNTVDDGCLEKLPSLLEKLRMRGSVDVDNGDGNDEDALEVIVAHFLGVDHVGHTYGPHNYHMDDKLRQVDAALATTLEILDESESCHMALIFGDHGMTEDGNHGGGTDDEINAALFAHFSPACGAMPIDSTPQMGSSYIQDIFQSIHQIDLVPTISVLLGLPIPYANLGGIVPSLLGAEDIRQTAAALALNAAQLWRYFTVYSSTANKLPSLPELEQHLRTAVHKYQQALAHSDAEDSIAYYEASGLFKVFLVEASELGHRVWTRFDSTGMVAGAAILLAGLVAACLVLAMSVPAITLPTAQMMEVGLATIFVFFQSAVLTFSNSYILAEQSIVMFMLSILALAVCVRYRDGSNATVNATAAGHAPYQGRHNWRELLPFTLPVMSRMGECLITGHGLDSSIRLHAAHNSMVFLTSLSVLGFFRVRLFRSSSALATPTARYHAAVDCIVIALVAIGWIEKRDADTSRNGYSWMSAAISLLLLSIPLAIFESIQTKRSAAVAAAAMPTPAANSKPAETTATRTASFMVDAALISKILIFIMVVTGPSTASTLVLFSIQASVWFMLVAEKGRFVISTMVLAILWRFVVRHTFFATNHACAFSRLQYSAAFVSTMEFNFALGGTHLFLNTFGWEVVGMMIVRMTATWSRRESLWRWYGLFQLLETSANCISVSLLRRHLMVWAIYAPRFLFSSIFLILHETAQLVSLLVS